MEADVSVYCKKTTRVTLDMQTATISARVLLSQLEHSVRHVHNAGACSSVSCCSTAPGQTHAIYVHPYSVHCTAVFVCVLSMLPIIIQSALAR